MLKITNADIQNAIEELRTDMRSVQGYEVNVDLHLHFRRSVTSETAKALAAVLKRTAQLRHDLQLRQREQKRLEQAAVVANFFIPTKMILYLPLKGEAVTDFSFYMDANFRILIEFVEKAKTEEEQDTYVSLAIPAPMMGRFNPVNGSLTDRNYLPLSELQIKRTVPSLTELSAFAIAKSWSRYPDKKRRLILKTINRIHVSMQGAAPHSKLRKPIVQKRKRAARKAEEKEEVVEDEDAMDIDEKKNRSSQEEEEDEEKDFESPHKKARVIIDLLDD